MINRIELEKLYHGNVVISFCTLSLTESPNRDYTVHTAVTHTQAGSYTPSKMKRNG